MAGVVYNPCPHHVHKRSVFPRMFALILEFLSTIFVLIQNRSFMKQITGLILLIVSTMLANGQTSAPQFNFIDYQRSIPRISDVLKKKEDTLMKQFREQKTHY